GLAIRNRVGTECLPLRTFVLITAVMVLLFPVTTGLLDRADRQRADRVFSLLVEPAIEGVALAALAGITSIVVSAGGRFLREIGAAAGRLAPLQHPLADRQRTCAR